MTALVGPALLTVVGIIALLFAREFGLWTYGSPGAGLIPAIAASLLIAASLSDIRFSAASNSWHGLIRKPLCYIIGLLAVVLLTPLAGLLPALALFIFAILYFVESLSAVRAGALAAISVAGSWLLFERLLSVTLPRSVLW